MQNPKFNQVESIESDQVESDQIARVLFSSF